MTIGTTYQPAVSVASGGTVFPFSFELQDAAHLHVELDGVPTSTGFTVTLNADQSANPGGYVTFSVAPTSGVVVDLEAASPFQRTNDYQHGAAFNSDNVDFDQDYQTILIKQLLARIARAPVLNPKHGILGPLELPRGIADGILKWNASNTALEVVSAQTLLGFSVQVISPTLFVDTVSNLKALAAGAQTYVMVGGYYAKGDLGGGLFYWDAASTATDNGGTVIRPNSLPASGRWLRIYDGAVSVKWFGAKGDGVTNDGPAWQAVLDWAKARGGGTLWVPFGKYITNQRLKYQNTDAKLLIFGEGRGNQNVAWTATQGSLLVGQTNGILLDASGCNGLTLQDVGLFSGTTNPSVIGVHLQRTSVNQFCAYFQTVRVSISMATAPAANGGVGSIGIMNKRGEHHHHVDSWFAADRPLILDGNSVYAAIVSPDYAESFPGGATLSLNQHDNCGLISFSGDCLEMDSTFRVSFRGGYMLIFTGMYGVQSVVFNASPEFIGMAVETSAGTPLAWLRLTGSIENLQAAVTNSNITNMAAIRLGPAAQLTGGDVQFSGVFAKIFNGATEVGGPIKYMRSISYDSSAGHTIAIADATIYDSYLHDRTAVTTTGGLEIRTSDVSVMTGLHTGGMAPPTTTTGTDTTPSVTETYICEVWVPASKLLTGIALLNGSAVAGNVKFALADRTGAIVASTASTAQAGIAAYQRVAFSAQYLAKGPATYYVLVTFNNTGARFRSHILGNFGASKKTGETYGTHTTITAPTTFTTGQGAIADVY